MTSSVKVTAHCGDDVELRVLCVELGSIKEVHRLKDGEEMEIAVFDDIEVRVQEIKKK